MRADFDRAEGVRYIIPAVFFDLEGPFTSGDVAAQLFDVVAERTGIHQYRKVFPMISSWVAKKVNSSPYSDFGSIQFGETLRFISPFFYLAEITDGDAIGDVRFLPKARECVKELYDNNWQIFVVTTSYHQHASQACMQLGIPEDHLASTDLPLNIRINDRFDLNGILEIHRKYENSGCYLRAVSDDLELFF